MAVNSRPKRRAAATQSPNPLDNTQFTDASTQPSQPSVGESQISDAASDALEHPNFSDDYTDSSDEVEDEERSVNTDTGLPDTQASDSPYLTRADKKKKKKRKQKKENKKAKKSSKKREESKSDRRKNLHHALLHIRELHQLVRLHLVLLLLSLFSPMQHNRRNMLDCLYVPLLISYLN